jgi:uncharacterized protein (TIGR02391 family)
MDHLKLQKQYGRLKGLREIISIQSTTYKETGDDYNNIVEQISENIGDDLSDFKLTGEFYYRGGGGNKLYCQSDTIREKLFQLISYLEYGFKLSEKVIEIGSIYNSIMDDELKARCSDILSAPGNFDRVINQSTQVLEDRIRNKSKSDRQLVGVNLVNKALNSDLSKTIIKASGNQEEHEGICHICRGIMIGFRNPSHHHLTDTFTREDALKFCAFIDNILKIIDRAKLNENNL